MGLVQEEVVLTPQGMEMVVMVAGTQEMVEAEEVMEAITAHGTMLVAAQAVTLVKVVMVVWTPLMAKRV